jgi:hypothetical protein
MIARIWRGSCAVENAAAYESLLTSTILPGIHRVRGYRGALLLKRVDVGGAIEFTTVTLFEDLEAVRRFAGADYETAVVPPAARALLARFDARSEHQELLFADVQPPPVVRDGAKSTS